MTKMKRKTISITDVTVWGDEIASRPIVACNGEQSGVNWGELGHWATGCTSIVVGYQFISEWIAEPRMKKKEKKRKLIISYLISQIGIIFCWRQSSAVAEIEFTFIWSFSGSLIEAPFISMCDVTVLMLVNINILDLVTHERTREKLFVGHLQERGALGLFFRRWMSATCRRNDRMAPMLTAELREKRE